jgi:hypothetical protein
MLLDGARTDVQLRPNLFITASLYQRSPSFRKISKLGFLWSESKEARLSPKLRCSAHRRSSTCDCLYFTPEAWKRKAKEVLRTSPLWDKLCHNEKRGREKVHGEENAGSQPFLHQNFLTCLLRLRHVREHSFVRGARSVPFCCWLPRFLAPHYWHKTNS